MLTKVLNNLFMQERYNSLRKTKYFEILHSTVYGLVTLTDEDIRKSINEGKLRCVAFIDLQKAFDTVDHKIILKN